MNKILLKIIAQAAYMILFPNMSRICIWFHDIFGLIIQSSLNILNNQFPADTIVERETRGTFVKFLTNARGTIIVNLDNTVTAQYQKLLDLLDKVRKS